MQTGDDCPEAETHEVLVILQADAVASPRAVVVHPHYTLSAHAAVVRSRRLDVVAFLADSKSDERLVLWIDVNCEFLDIWDLL